jgi:hypothetical protein
MRGACYEKGLALLLAVILVFGLSGSAFAKPASSTGLAEKVKVRNDALVHLYRIFLSWF